MNKALFKILTVVAAVFILAACTADGQGTSEEVKKYVHIPPSLPDSVFKMIKPGDVVIRQGNGPLSFHLMNATKEDYSHCGIVVQEEGKWKVIHTIGGSASEESVDGVQMQDLTEFVAHASDSMFFICRPIFQDSLEYKVPERAYYYLDQEVPFDHGFSIFTPEKFYCTELLFYIFRDIHGKNIFEIQKKNKSYMLMFSTFFDEEKFQPIFHLKEDNKK